MMATELDNWPQANQDYLCKAVVRVRNKLERYIRMRQGNPEDEKDKNDEAAGHKLIIGRKYPAAMAPFALNTLVTVLGLSSFERDLLVLCAGVELDAGFAALCAAAQGNSLYNYPTFSLALSVLPGAHWSALSPEAPLRRWRLIEVGAAGMGAGSGLVFSPLRIDEWALHYLTGVPHLDERLVGFLESLGGAATLVPSHRVIVEQISSGWASSDGSMVVQLCGDDNAVKRAIATNTCTTLGMNLYLLPADLLPASPGDLNTFIRLWQREFFLNYHALLVECDELDPADIARANALTRFVERSRGLLIVATRERRHISHPREDAYDVYKPGMSEQRAIWLNALGDVAPGIGEQVDRVVSQFSLSPEAIYAASAEARAKNETLWNASRHQTRPRMLDLAQRIESSAAWNDLVLPEQQYQILREISAQVRQRVTVYETWGLGSRSSRGLGISALFAGASGTGKTMAAEVLANELHLDLYRIDLSSVVSKYIGETEKNLRRVFDAAKEGGTVLLFDEADALFGKRSEVTDSHDRYANIEVSYLLQCMETYRGLAILTTNLKSALDPAFLRRIRFIVQFPFPDFPQRLEIWRRIFPTGAPTEGLDIQKLARLNAAGGNIRNIALNAAFLAADAGEPIRMAHLLRAARSEYAKLERMLTNTEIGGWV